MAVDSRPHLEKIHPTAFVAPGATVVGDVTLAEEASVWFGVVIRGDTESIRIGPRTNVQDGCILHADPGQPCTLGVGVSLGHGAIVHGATVEDEALVGIRAVVLNGARIGRGSIVGAGAVVPPGTQIPAGCLVLGTPGRVTRATGPDDWELIRRTAAHYVEFAKEYKREYGP